MPDMQANWNDLVSITSPAAFNKDTTLVCAFDGHLQFTGTAPLGFVFNWLREVSAAKFAGDLGLKINTAQNISLSFSLAGDFVALVSLDSERWLNLRLFKRKELGCSFASEISAEAQFSSPFPHNADDLVAAILGVAGTDTADLDRAFQEFADFSALSPMLRRRLQDVLGIIKSSSDFEKAQAGFQSIVALRDSIYHKALPAIEKKYRAELSYRYQSSSEDTALFDGSFAFTNEGLEAYRRALAGNLCFEKDEHVRLHNAVLTHGISRQSTVELHLPFLSRKEWNSRLEALAKVAIEDDEGGRLLAYTVDASQRIAVKNSYQSTLALAGGLSFARIHSASAFTLAYTDQRKLRPAQLRAGLMPVLEAYGFDGEARQWLASIQARSEIETSLTLSIPSRLAAAWLRAPLEHEPDFAETYARMSVAVQQALRKWLPFVYFSDPSRYDTIRAAYPLLAYRSSRPFPGRGRTEFAYDVMNKESTALSHLVPISALARELAIVQRLLIDCGKANTARFYAPKQAPKVLQTVRRNPRLMDALLYADAVFVNQLIQLGVHGRRFGKEAQSDPEQAVRKLARFAEDLVKTFHGRLKRLYGGQAFLSFGSLLLVEATNALSADLRPEAPIQAVLTITAGNVKQTFVNGEPLAL